MRRRRLAAVKPLAINLIRGPKDKRGLKVPRKLASLKPARLEIPIHQRAALI
jgi:hypothetical protein